MPETELHKFYHAYHDSALATVEADHGSDPEVAIDPDSIPAETRRQMLADCEQFLNENRSDIGRNISSAGYDFWLSRNAIGTGFLDPEQETLYGTLQARRLERAAKDFGPFPILIDDKEISEES
jgi:hypothetical protein